jgi:hypothetical protein
MSTVEQEERGGIIAYQLCDLAKSRDGMKPEAKR